MTNLFDKCGTLVHQPSLDLDYQITKLVAQHLETLPELTGTQVRALAEQLSAAVQLPCLGRLLRLQDAKLKRKAKK